VEHEAYINLIIERDPRLSIISVTWLSRNLIPKTTTEIVKNVQHMLTHVPAVSLSFDLWMSRRADELFSLDGHYIAVKSCIDKFHLISKVIRLF
jgi:hypothetical protein